MGSWWKATHAALKQKLAAARDHIKELTRLQEGEKDRTAKNDLANLQLVNHIHELTAEVAALKADAGEHQESLAQQQALVEESVVHERSLRNEISLLQSQATSSSHELQVLYPPHPL